MTAQTNSSGAPQAGVASLRAVEPDGRIVSRLPFAITADWEGMLNTAMLRLRKAVDANASRSPGDPDAEVRDCLRVLEGLHARLAQALRQHDRLEAEVLDARTALSTAVAELVDTQAEERQARHRAEHDGLTGLPNGRCFRERLTHVLSNAEPLNASVAVLYLDLDGFKIINDTHGHEVGDALLKIVGARLSRSLRARDMVGRLGGDEFACLLSDMPNRELLSHLVWKLLDAVSAPMKIGALELVVRTSIGIAMCPYDGLTAEALLGAADAAMYRAKRQRSGFAYANGHGGPAAPRLPLID